MNVYTEMAKYPVFSIGDLNTLTNNEKTSYSQLNRLMKKGLIKKVRNNIYSVVNPTTGLIVATRYQIACAITNTAYLSHRSAFEYYGLTNQAFYEIYVSSETKFNHFEYDNVHYKYVNSRMREGVVEARNTSGVRITDLERTVIDSIRDYNKIGGFEEVLNEEMLEKREVINDTIKRYMRSQGYSMNPKTKNPHSLDSRVYSYQGASGNKDNIKIEINYSLRSHILEAKERAIITEHFLSKYKVNSLAPLEIYGSKINALLSRAAARDLYDTRNMIRFGIFDESEKEMLKKCVVFYAAISAKDINKTFDIKAIDSITNQKIKRELLPVIKRENDFELKSAKKLVKEYISELMILEKEEKEFLERFENGEYIPELLFDDKKILDRIKNHPMALWKTR